MGTSQSYSKAEPSINRSLINLWGSRDAHCIGSPIKFEYEVATEHSSKYIIYTNVKLTKDVELINGTIPSIFYYNVIHIPSMNKYLFCDIKGILYYLAGGLKISLTNQTNFKQFDFDPIDIKPFEEALQHLNIVHTTKEKGI